MSAKAPGVTQNRAAFLALREDIRDAIKDRWPVKTIWETLHEEGKIKFSYQAFRNYTNNLILNDDRTPAAAPQEPATTEPTSGPGNVPMSETTLPQPKPVSASSISTGFEFNTKPDRDKLI